MKVLYIKKVSEQMQNFEKDPSTLKKKQKNSIEHLVSVVISYHLCYIEEPGSSGNQSDHHLEEARVCKQFSDII